MERNKKPVAGVGINDSESSIADCPLYAKWGSMLDRCYGRLKSKYNPSYLEAEVCKEWLLFSNFRCWMEDQHWQGKHLDKDILHINNKIYAPDKCVFIEPLVNTFINDRERRIDGMPLGVRIRGDRFRAICSNPFTKKQEHLGYFCNENLAHKAWRKRKYELACQLADMQSDSRVAEALRKRYLQP